MKILAIRTRNLASLEEDNAIDFSAEPLRSAGIFAITGPTGAGKSTLLDALCLALYSRTPRYAQARENGVEIQDVSGNTLGQSDSRGILRDGTAEGYAEVDFVGVDNKGYRATWSVRRARNRADGSMQAYSVQLKDLDKATDFPGKKTEVQQEIERLVGLNFEQFTRSVLLAQGDFTAFLKAGKDEKSSLLEKLTGTNIYSEISRLIFERNRDEQQKIRELNLRLGGVVLLGKEETEEIAAGQEQLVITLRDVEQEITSLTEENNWHKRLGELAAAIGLAGTELDAATLQRDQAAELRQQLKLAEDTREIRSWFGTITGLEKALLQKSEEFSQRAAGIVNLKSEKEQQEQAVRESGELQSAALQAVTDARPLLAEAAKLEIQSSEGNRQKNTAEKEVDAVSQRHAGLLKRKAEVGQEQQQLQTETEQLSGWFESHQNRSKVAVNEVLIRTRLQEASGYTTVLAELKNTETSLGAGLDRLQQLNEQSAIQLSEKASILAALRKQLDEYAAKQGSVKTGDLNAERAQIDEQIQETVTAQSAWTLLYQLLMSVEASRARITETRSRLEEKSKLEQGSAGKLQAALIRRDTSSAMLEKALLAAAENVEQLRTKLTPGEPCMVCGSTEHPYAVAGAVVGHVLSELEKEHVQLEKEYTGLLALCSGLSQEISGLQHQQEQLSIDLEKQETAVDEHQKLWEKQSIYNTIASVPDEGKTAWLIIRLQSQQEKRQDIRDRVDEQQELLRKYDALKQQFDDAQSELSALQEQQKDRERELTSATEKLADTREQRARNNERLQQIADALGGYFPEDSGWFANWLNSGEVFVRQITEFAALWESKLKRQSECDRQSGVLASTLLEVQRQLEEVEAELAGKKESLQSLQTTLDALTVARNQLFNGKPVEEAEAELQDRLTIATENHERISGLRDQLVIRLATEKAQQEQLGKDVTLRNKELEESNRQVDDWFNAYNQHNDQSVSHEQLRELVLLPAQWISETAQQLKQLEDRWLNAATVLNERREQLEVHHTKQDSKREFPEVQQLLGDKGIEHETLVRRKNELAFRLREDELNRTKAGKLLEELEQAAHSGENWARLNEVIGSADGRKFRQIAQEYTLDALLEYANIHLEMLTRRYRVERIPGTLGLQVIDQDMGDEIRTVYSLSGGESFLVSLALALGLASLSSSRVKVESLFIDEGFGSLDPVTLSIAMDALERLHNQGRKVGVISHVQEMTERIPVQIRVTRVGSGRSKVEVVG
ncbi:MAG: AAA family ATPase [Bacteroidota bacterium]